MEESVDGGDTEVEAPVDVGDGAASGAGDGDLDKGERLAGLAVGDGAGDGRLLALPPCRRDYCHDKQQQHCTTAKGWRQALEDGM